MAAVGSYLYLAKKDFRAAKNAKASEDYDVSGRLFEQVAEKSLKHYLHQFGDPTNPADERLLHSHKPFNIYMRCVALGLTLTLDTGEKSLLKSLGDWYYDTNYPNNNYTELTTTDVSEAEIVVEKIFTFIENYFISLPTEKSTPPKTPLFGDITGASS